MTATQEEERTFTVIIERDEDGVFVGSVVELPGCHTQAHDLETLISRINEAVQLYLEVAEEHISNIEFIGIHRIKIKTEK